ncbi:MAG: hypothetical protein LUC24_07460 [Bacteroidales bacterium]|nr:hypothetical protein [Bacteroidales bacterium]
MDFQLNNIKKIIVSLAILASAVFFCKAGNDRWPNGEVVAEWFADTTRVDVNSLGSRYVITDYGVVRDSTAVQTGAIRRVIDFAAADGGGVVVMSLLPTNIRIL